MTSAVTKAFLKQNQLEALKSLSMLLVREINSLEETETALVEKVQSENSICLSCEMERIRGQNNSRGFDSFNGQKSNEGGADVRY